LLLLLFFSVTSFTPAQTAAKPEASLDDLAKMLNGNWAGGGKGEPGAGEGKFSFAYDLQNKVIVRKSHSEYPAANGRPAVIHDDLMTVYTDPASNKLKAIYFDNERHVISYNAELAADKQSVVFLSDLLSGQPRFRLSYTKQKDGTINVKFEIAPPGKPDDFTVYLNGIVHKDN
jgi:hypothetical protein